MRTLRHLIAAAVPVLLLAACTSGSTDAAGTPGSTLATMSTGPATAAGASATGSADSTPTAPVTSTGASPGPSGSAPGCPSGTQAADGLCVGADPAAAQAAELVRTAFTTEHLAAVIVGVWRDGQPVVVGALGESMTGVPATPDMHHITGNVTTAMLTTVLLQLAEEGTLRLDDPLSTWFPDLPSADAVTLDMLAHNTSGYAHYPNSDAFRTTFYADPFARLAPADLVQDALSEPVAFPPGTSWAFADTNLVLLQMVIEKATGRPMGELMRERIWEPLGMTGTTPATSADMREPVLHGYTGERGVWEDSTFWSPSWIQYAGGVGSNQDDLRRFIEALGSGELLSPDSHRKQLAPDTVGMGPFTEDFYYAMGTGLTNGWVFVNPSLQGYTAAVANLPEEKLTIVLCSTRTQAADQDKLQASQLFSRLGALLAPDHAPTLPAG